MADLIDLTGKRYGKLTVISRAPNYRNGTTVITAWNCHCDCGNDAVVLRNNLKSGATRSCGCLRRRNFEKRYKDE